MSTGSGVAQGRKRVQQLKLCKNDKNSIQKKHNKKWICSKLSAVVASANFQQKTKISSF